MKTYRAKIRPLTAFGTRLLGDTLFGQICWALRNRDGDDALKECLQGYLHSEPFLVVSDAMPSNFWPRPTLPDVYFSSDLDDRKLKRSRTWLPHAAFDHSVREWIDHCHAVKDTPGAVTRTNIQAHNTINRWTGTTGSGAFAPYTQSLLWYDRAGLADALQLDIHFVLDSDRLPPDTLQLLLCDIGLAGFGRDATIGMGRFELQSFEEFALPVQQAANAWLTLAPIAPQGLGFDAKKSYYRTFTRFGKHGDMAIHLGNPFKTPLLLAQTGAVFTSANADFSPALFIGQGVGGQGSGLSQALPETVHQGYAPVVGVNLPEHAVAETDSRRRP